MPELPEVETIVRSLRQPLVGRTFADVEVSWSRTVATPSPAELAARLPGQRVEAIGRRGKYLVFSLSRGRELADTLLIHLKMSGWLRLAPADEPVHKHVRAILSLDDGRQLRFRDMRKFGRLYLVADPDEVVGHLGPEPLAKDFSPAELGRLLQKRSRQIKPLLLDQTFLAGVGNIYADESLFRAGLDPRRRANSLSEPEIERLYHGVCQVLSQAIKHGGTDLGNGVYRRGSHREQLRVYGRTEEPCLVCGTPISRIRLGQRSTHFCPRCQT